MTFSFHNGSFGSLPSCNRINFEICSREGNEEPFSHEGNEVDPPPAAPGRAAPRLRRHGPTPPPRSSVSIDLVVGVELLHEHGLHDEAEREALDLDQVHEDGV
jgi:hypothetical protein